MYAKSRIRREKRITVMSRYLLHDIMLTMMKLYFIVATIGIIIIIIIIIQFKCKSDEFNRVLNYYKSITMSSDAPLHETVHIISLFHYSLLSLIISNSPFSRLMQFVNDHHLNLFSTYTLYLVDQYYNNKYEIIIIFFSY